MKPKYRYNWATEQWDALVRFRRFPVFVFSDPFELRHYVFDPNYIPNSQ